MGTLTKEQIDKINRLSPREWQSNEQGIFTEPYGIPIHIKEPVIYCRYETGGVSGGSCWDDSDPQPYIMELPKNRMKVLDLVLEELKQDITYSQYRQIQNLIHTNQETDYQYYGNSTDFQIEYIILSDLIKLLESF